jgi:phage baseplate assembly protein W
MTTLGFPFAIKNGRIGTSKDDEAIRGKIIQVLFTRRGERVNVPEFGCGLYNLVFEPNNTILAAATEFEVREALTRWLKDDIEIDDVNVYAKEEQLIVEIFYTTKRDRVRRAIEIHY